MGKSENSQRVEVKLNVPDRTHKTVAVCADAARRALCSSTHVGDGVEGSDGQKEEIKSKSWSPTRGRSNLVLEGLVGFTGDYLHKQLQ